jgi:two-component system sensor histidine kinase EvgS
VSDTGIGIPPAEIENIFEAFRQGSNRNLFGKAGVGLGLYIVQRLVQRLGGEITVDSRLDQGSTFTARLPRLLHHGDAVEAEEPASDKKADRWPQGPEEIELDPRPSSLAPRP